MLLCMYQPSDTPVWPIKWEWLTCCGFPTSQDEKNFMLIPMNLQQMGSIKWIKQLITCAGRE